MQKARPDALLIQAPAEGSCACNECPFMKMNTLEKIALALETMSPRVEVPADLIERSRIGLRRMLDITDGKPVTWPGRFEWK